MNPGLSTFCRMEYPGREAHWLKVQGYLDTSLAWRRTPGVVLCDSVPMVLSVVFWLLVSKQVCKQVGSSYTPTGLRSLRFLGSELTRPCQFLCVYGSMVPHALSVFLSFFLPFFLFLSSFLPFSSFLSSSLSFLPLSFLSFFPVLFSCILGLWAT